MAEHTLEKLAEKMGTVALCILVLGAAAGLLANSLVSALRIVDLMSAQSGNLFVAR